MGATTRTAEEPAKTKRVKSVDRQQEDCGRRSDVESNKQGVYNYATPDTRWEKKETNYKHGIILESS